MPNGENQIVEMETNDGTNNDYPTNTYFRMKAQEADVFLSLYLGQGFPGKDFTIGDEAFPFMKKDGYYYFPDFAMGWLSYVVPYMRRVYELTPDIYYVDFIEYEMIQDFDDFSESTIDQTPPSEVFDKL